MTRKVLGVVLGLMVLPVGAWAQLPTYDCPTCELGLWDQQEMLTNFGAAPAPFTPKDIYLGIKYNGSVETGLTTIEFSVHGMRQAEDNILITTVEGVTSTPPNVFIGEIHAPVDTTAGSTGTGGLSVAWPGCVSGSTALLRISFLVAGAIQPNKVFTVLRKYPPTLLSFPHPYFTRCDVNFSKVNTGTGCYVLGWDQTTNPVGSCTIHMPAVSRTTWGAMKQLYN